MSFVIAVAGKGGTGKTTTCALLIYLLSKMTKGSILGIDADPNSNLAEAMGLKVKEDIGGIVDAIAKNPQMVPVGTPKETFIDYRIQTSIIESDGFDIMTMGRPEGPGCYCYVNNLLRGLIKKLSDSYDYIVIDNEAGFEHLSRRTMRRADQLFLVADSSEAGLRAARRIYDLIKELNIEIKKIALVLNRTGENNYQEKIKDFEIEVAGVIPENEDILSLSRQGLPVIQINENSPVAIKLREILEKIIKVLSN